MRCFQREPHPKEAILGNCRLLIARHAGIPKWPLRVNIAFKSSSVFLPIFLKPRACEPNQHSIKEKHMKRVLAIAFIGLAVFAPPALADDDDSDEYRRGYRVSLTEARYIAYDYGLAWFKEIKRGNGNWEIEGCTGDGQEIEIDISGRTGEIVKLEYEDDDKCWD
jgi:hypothetical protein